jgi:hypothetical protein
MVILDDKPGEFARLGEVAGAARVNIDGFAAFTGEGKGVVHVLIGVGAALAVLHGRGVSRTCLMSAQRSQGASRVAAWE